MRILWIVNLVLPQLSEELKIRNSASGTWLFEWSKKLSESNNTFAVACVYGDEFRTIETKGIKFYLLPGTGKNMLFYTKKYEKYWKQIVDEFKPDIINIHGTEYSHGLSCMRANPQEHYLVSMQGILTKIKDVDFGGLTKRDILFNRTFKENIKFNGLIENHIIHVKNHKYELEMIKRADAIAYVNDFDYGFTKSVNAKAEFFNVDYDMQAIFKESNKWNVDTCKRHIIFTNPGGTPLKGLHQLLKAIAIIKEEYPDLLVVVPGMGCDGKLVVKNGYSKYISKLINKLDISSNVSFLSYQTPSEMCSNMLNANVVVIPSAIEGTSLILREAMYLGCPCVVSLRGGMANYISNGVNAFGYEYNDYQKLADIIKNVFSMGCSELTNLSKRAIERTKYYDTSKSFDSLIFAYQSMINKNMNEDHIDNCEQAISE
ncbi:MAG: glycosyltransferase [Bacilli bacterium]|nr:glycosyltransferase [Bacilli bacterium]